MVVASQIRIDDVTDTAAAVVAVHHDPVAEWRRKSRRQVDEVTLEETTHSTLVVNNLVNLFCDRFL